MPEARRGCVRNISDLAEQHANARLIAKAPDMHDLLCAIYDELEGMEDADHNGERYVPNFAMSIRQRIDEVLG